MGAQKEISKATPRHFGTVLQWCKTMMPVYKYEINDCVLGHVHDFNAKMVFHFTCNALSNTSPFTGLLYYITFI